MKTNNSPDIKKLKATVSKRLSFFDYSTMTKGYQNATFLTVSSGPKDSTLEGVKSPDSRSSGSFRDLTRKAVLHMKNLLMVKTSLIYAVSGFFMFALQAQTLDAPTMMIQEYNDHFTVKKSVRQIQLSERQMVQYLMKNMRYATKDRALKLSRLVSRLARQTKLPAGLILSVMKVESNFQPWAVSNKGALGLMQIMPDTGEWLARRFGMNWQGPASLLEEDFNVTLGARYLAYLRDKYDGNLHAMLSAYNRGPAKVDEDLNSGRRVKSEYSEKVRVQLPRLAAVQVL